MSTATTVEYQSPTELDDTTATALHHMLRAIADTKLLLGYHYGEWTFGTPELEAAVANCSLSQSELGHVRLIDGILKKAYGDDPDRTLEERSPGAFANIDYLDQDLPGWPGCIAMNAVVDYAVTHLLASMQDSTFRPVRLNVAKMLDEERYHVHHGRGWVRTWAGRDAAATSALSEAMGTALTSVARWFGPDGEPEDLALVQAGIKDKSNTEVFAAVRADLDQLADEVGLSWADGAAPDFSDWSAVTRRGTSDGPSEAILGHLRGDRNDIFKRS